MAYDCPPLPKAGSSTYTRNNKMVEMTCSRKLEISDQSKNNALYISFGSEIEKSAVVRKLTSTVHKSYYQI